MSADNIAIITGAARRIGHEITRTLAEAGFYVALHTSARSQPQAETLAADLRARGKKAIVVVANLENADEVATIVPHVAKTLGPVTLLVNNASIFEEDTAMGLDPANLDRHMAINLRAPLILSSALANQLPHGTKGNIINIIDQRVWRLNPKYFSYTLSKAALWTATQTLAQSLAPHIRVNAIGPGPTLANSRQDMVEFAKEARAVLLQQCVEPAEIAAAMLYLVHARSVTGQMIAVDGGQHLAWRTPDVVGSPE